MESKFHISLENVGTITLFCLLTMTNLSILKQIFHVFDTLIQFQFCLFVGDLNFANSLPNLSKKLSNADMLALVKLSAKLSISKN